MSQKANKELLRSKVQNLLNTGVNEKVIREFIDAVTRVTNPNSVHTLTPKQIDNVFKSIAECDAACGFGPGHQSTALCTLRGPHGSHYNHSYELEWDDKRGGTQTIERNGKTYRLGFSDKGWY